MSAAFLAALRGRAAVEARKAEARKVAGGGGGGRHAYSLAEFGLEQGDLDRAFGAYTAMLEGLRPTGHNE